MVTQYGMTERLGAIKLGSRSGEPFLGRDMGHERDYSEEVAAVIDEEAKRLIETAHHEACDILVENRDVLDELVLELLEKETLDKEEVAEIFEPLRRRPVRPAWTGSADPGAVADPAGRRCPSPPPTAPARRRPRAPDPHPARQRW